MLVGNGSVFLVLRPEKQRRQKPQNIERGKHDHENRDQCLHRINAEGADENRELRQELDQSRKSQRRHTRQHEADSQMRHIVRLMKDDDSDEMAILQRKYIPDDISSLKAEAIYQLLEIWASIFIFVQIMSLVSNYEYRSLIRRLSQLIPLDTYENAVKFYDIYNSTHGFKYIGMFAALIIGIFVTAVFLKDRFLKIVTVSVTGVFMLAFTIFQMITFETNFKIISIVWTSIIYHGLETIGLILFAIYLSKNYKGL